MAEGEYRDFEKIFFFVKLNNDHAVRQSFERWLQQCVQSRLVVVIQWNRIDPSRSYTGQTLYRKDTPYTTQLQLIMNFYHMAVISVRSSIELHDRYSISRKKKFFQNPCTPPQPYRMSKFFFHFSRELSLPIYLG